MAGAADLALFTAAAEPSQAAGPLSSRVPMLGLLEALLTATALCRKENTE